MKKCFCFFGIALFAIIFALSGCGGGASSGGGVSEPPVNVEDALDDGVGYLNEENIDDAVKAFEDAFKNDHPGSDTYTKTVVYSSLAQLASIPVDPVFQSFVKDRLGVKNYPTTLAALVSGSWMESYQTEDLFPGFEIPSWFADTQFYNDSLILQGDNLVQSADTMPILMFASLLDKNTSGLNDILDGILNSVFGSSFETVAGRASLLSYNDFFLVDQEILQLFGIYEMFEGDVQIGRAELDILFSALRIVKATLEWVSSYDWNTDLSFAKTEWKNIEENAGDILDGITDASLPFKNNFLKARKNNVGAARMASSKADFVLSINTIVNAYDAIIGKVSYLPPAVKDFLDEVTWMKAELNALKDSIQNGTAFYFKKSSGTTYPDPASLGPETVFAIHFGNFFTAGYLGIDKLIACNSSGLPYFYGFMDEKDDGTQITDAEDINSYEMIGFRVNLSPIKDLILYGMELPEGDFIGLPIIPPDAAGLVYGLYY